MSEFYDENWKKLLRSDPLAAKKIEDLRCECVTYEQYKEEMDFMLNKIVTLEKERAVEQKEIDALKQQLQALMRLATVAPARI